MSEGNSVKKIFDKLYDETPKENMMDLYSKWANSYEKDVVYKDEGYKGFEIIAKVIDIFSVNKSIEILDIAAGTGLVAQELRKLGYSNIDAMDPCENMLSKAKEKSLYRNYYCQYATDDEKEDKHGKYDHVCIAGGFSKNHMSYLDISKVIKYAKIGSYISLCFRFEAINSYQKEVPSELTRLEKEDVVEIIMRTEVPKYYTDITGYLVILKRKL